MTKAIIDTISRGSTEIIFKERPELKDPILIEGLPGIGYVGRNAAGYLVEELGAKKFAELHSSHFPPVVLLDSARNGRIVGLKHELYYYKGKSQDLVMLIGDAQSMDSVGHYEIANAILDASEQVGVKQIITIGGFGTGQLTEKEPRVFGAGIDDEIIREFSKLGVVFKDTNIGQIIGASGLLISLGWNRKIPGICLMGETSGMLLSDPKSTEAVLKVIEKYLNIHVDMTKIEQRVKEIEKVIKKIEDLQKQLTAPKTGKEGDKEQPPLGYIG